MRDLILRQQGQVAPAATVTSPPEAMSVAVSVASFPAVITTPVPPTMAEASAVVVSPATVVDFEW